MNELDLFGAEWIWQYRVIGLHMSCVRLGRGGGRQLSLSHLSKAPKHESGYAKQRVCKSKGVLK